MRRLLFLLLLLLLPFPGCAMREAARKDAAYHYQKGLAYLGENNVTGGLIELTEAEKGDPDNPELLHYLGLAYFRKNRFDLAEQKFLRALQLKPNYSEVRNDLGVNYMEMKRWDDAIQQLKQVTDDIFYRDQPSANINLGLSYYGKRDYVKALATFRAVVGGNPRDPRAHLHLGKVYQALDKMDLAVEEMKKATELFEDYGNAWYSLGLAYMKTKEPGEARAAFRQVLRIAPESELGQLSREHLDSLK